MRRIAVLSFSLTLTAIALPSAAAADACRDEIIALMKGALDPFNRPPHQQKTIVYDPDGNVKWDLLSLVETPLRTISGQPSSNWFTMAIDQDVWNGPAPDGPWTSNAGQMPADREATMRQGTLDNIENLSDTDCLGPDENGNNRYVYRTKTNPDASGGFFGSLDTITVDAASGEVILFDRTEFINSWSDGVSMERWVTEVIFDDSIRVNPPQ